MLTRMRYHEFYAVQRRLFRKLFASEDSTLQVKNFMVPTQGAHHNVICMVLHDSQKRGKFPPEKVRHLETPLLGFPGRLLHLDYKYTQHPVRTVGHTCTHKWTSVWKLFDKKRQLDEQQSGQDEDEDWGTGHAGDDERRQRRRWRGGGASGGETNCFRVMQNSKT